MEMRVEPCVIYLNLSMLIIYTVQLLVFCKTLKLFINFLCLAALSARMNRGSAQILEPVSLFRGWFQQPVAACPAEGMGVQSACSYYEKKRSWEMPFMLWDVCFALLSGCFDPCRQEGHYWSWSRRGWRPRLVNKVQVTGCDTTGGGNP